MSRCLGLSHVRATAGSGPPPLQGGGLEAAPWSSPLRPRARLIPLPPSSPAFESSLSGVFIAPSLVVSHSSLLVLKRGNFLLILTPFQASAPCPFFPSFIYLLLKKKKLLNLFGRQDLFSWYVGSSSLTRGGTWAPCIGSTDHPTTREVPPCFLKRDLLSRCPQFPFISQATVISFLLPKHTHTHTHTHRHANFLQKRLH